jgi:hypothetical protein
MTHSTVTVVIRDASTSEEALAQLEWLMEPFDENAETEPYPEYVDADSVMSAQQYYTEHPEQCTGEDGPTQPFHVYVTEGNLEAWNEWTRMAVGSWSGRGPESGIYDAENDRFGYLSTYNPKSRWDWWTLGGRWHGFYQLKPKVNLASVEVPQWRKAMEDKHPVEGRVHGEEQLPTYDGSQDAVLGNGGTFGDEEGTNFEGRADLARKADIDFEAMRDLAAANADLTYDAYEKAVTGLELPESWPDIIRRVYFDHDTDPDETYDGYVMSRKAENLEPIPVQEWLDARREITNQARREYAEQPFIKALSKANLMPFMDDPHEVYCINSGGREAYVAHAREGAGLTHAVLIDGEWHEAGRMGWFGMVSDEKDPTTWGREFSRLIDRLPDEVFLAVVDVHI